MCASFLCFMATVAGEIKKKLKRILVGIIGKRKMVELRNKLRHQNEVE